MFLEPQTLIVVYEDELLANQLKKLVETNDDFNEDNIKGTTDGSVRIVAWKEKVWKDQKTAGNINNKVLFLGNIKGVKNLMPLIDLKYDKHGIRYGWAGNQAVLLCDRTKIKDAKDYNSFLEDFNKYNVPAELQSESRKVKDKKTINTDGNFFKKIGGAIANTAQNATKSIVDLYSVNNKKVKRQQYFLGIYEFYEHHLEEFLQK